MKKTFLTIVAVGFGVSVSFAQVTGPEQGTGLDQNQAQTEQRDDMYQDDEGRNEVSLNEVPNAVQNALRTGKYSNYQVISIHEKEGDAQDDGKYKVKLAEGGAAGQEAAAGEGMEGVSTQRVSDRQADVIVYFDENGQLLKEKDADEKKDKKKKKD